MSADLGVALEVSESGAGAVAEEEGLQPALPVGLDVSEQVGVPEVPDLEGKER